MQIWKQNFGKSKLNELHIRMNKSKSSTIPSTFLNNSKPNSSIDSMQIAMFLFELNQKFKKYRVSTSTFSDEVWLQLVPHKTSVGTPKSIGLLWLGFSLVQNCIQIMSNWFGLDYDEDKSIIEAILVSFPVDHPN